jgi:16S rRNA (cytidine1402-2'-O)-methyltransferase
VVATPIGNLEDVTLRALRVLREVDVVAAEDTRRTRVLLRAHGIEATVVSYYDAVERRRAPELVARMRAGARVALVSDAGTPGIADPGYHLVRGAVAEGIPVVPVPGASVVTALVSAAGLPVDRFAFEGFLPPRAAARAARLRALAGETRALVFLEAGRRLAGFLDDAQAALGDREAVIARELTKVHEELLRGRLSVLRWPWPAASAARSRCRDRSPDDRVALPAGAMDDAIGTRSPRAAAYASSARRLPKPRLPRREVYRQALEPRRSSAHASND